MRPKARGRPVRRAANVLTPFLLLLAFGWASAQPSEPAPPSAAVERAVAEAEAALDAARDADVPASPDVAVWATAIEAALDAVDLGGETPSEAAMRLVAEAYQGAGWWVRAVAAWEAMVDMHGPLIEQDLRDWRDAVTQLAYARYQAGQLEAAAARFAEVRERLPGDLEALRWLGRIALEQEDPESAIDLWAELVERSPNDDGARFYLDLARERARYGREASDAYREGLRLVDDERIDEAIDAFLRAEQAAPSWVEPIRWRARTLLDAGMPGATAAWQQVVDARPDDEGAAWFLERARLQAAYGPTALNAAEAANEATARDDPSAALEAWQRAVDAAPTWLDARLGVARAATAAGEAQQAQAAWERLLATLPEGDPLRHEARQGLATARLLGRLDPDVALDFVAAENAFERGDVDEAVARLEEVVEAAPETIEAWSFLGRIAFAQADWRTAARAYERASELDPSNEDLAFFAAEARSLAGPEPDAADPSSSP